MFRIKKQTEQSPCPPLELLFKHVASAQELSRQQRELVVDHVRQCAYCCDIYGVLCDIDEELGQDIRQGTGIAEPEFHPTRTVEEALADLWRRIDADEADQRRQRRRTLVFRIAAAAACILIAIGVGWLTLRPGSPGRHAPTIAANSGGSPAGFAELVTGQDRKPLAMNQPFATAGQPQEILLGGMHRVVMNRDTKATFSAASARSDVAHAGKVPYEIQLAQSELYVEVVPGNPFAIETATRTPNCRDGPHCRKPLPSRAVRQPSKNRAYYPETL